MEGLHTKAAKHPSCPPAGHGAETCAEESTMALELTSRYAQKLTSVRATALPPFLASASLEPMASALLPFSAVADT